MPQLNSATFVSQFFWLVISFMMMWLIVGHFIVPKISDILKRRQRKIDDCVAAAEEFRTTAEDLINRYNSAVSKAEKQAEDTWQVVHDEIKRQSEELHSDMNERLKKQLAESNKNLNRVEQMVKAKVNAMVADLSEVVVNKLELADINRDDIEKVLEQENHDE